ncbi:MAG: hypothetical protein IIA66_11575, partial [Planctomycetes bacterium]|nr:hypothetical protein [Planctomycetota bacterium]
MKRFKGIQEECRVMARNNKEIQRLTSLVPEVLAVAAKSEKTQGWEDLLRLEIEDTPVKVIDDMVLELKTLGELIAWANAHYQKNSKGARFSEWAKSLDKAYAENPRSWIVSFRVIRYAFRRQGFPARVIAIPQPNRADLPYLAL